MVRWPRGDRVPAGRVGGHGARGDDDRGAVGVSAAPDAHRRRRRGVVPPRSADRPPGCGRRAARVAAAAALRRRHPDLAGRLQRQQKADPPAQRRAGRVHDPRRRPARPRHAARARLVGRPRHRRRRGAAGRRRGDVDRPPDRAAPPDRDHPRGRVAVQRRDRAGRPAYGDRRRRRRRHDVAGRRRLPGRVHRRRGHRLRRLLRRGSATSPGHRPGPRRRDLVRRALRDLHPLRGAALLRRRQRRGRRPAARAQGADHPDRAVAGRRADELADDRLRPGEHRLHADRPPGEVDHRRRPRQRSVSRSGARRSAPRPWSR